MSRSVLLLLVLACAFSSGAAKVFNVFPDVHSVPGWRYVGPTTSPDFIRFSVALHARNIDTLKQELYNVADPRSENYGQWWTPQQVRDHVAPPAREQMRVQEWLLSQKLVVARYGDYQIVEGRASDVAKAFQTSFYTFENEITGEMTTRIIQYTIPEEIEDLVLMVSGLSGFPSKEDARHLKVYKPEEHSRYDSAGKIVPEVIWQLYNMAYTPEVLNYNSSLCLVAYTNLPAFRSGDLSNFEKNTLLPEIYPETIVGRFYSTIPLDESTLDVEHGIGIANNVSIWYWTTAGWLYDFNTEFLASDDFPNVVSMSYGYPEDGQCDIGDCNGLTNEEYTQTVNTQYLQVSLRGVTIVVSSGDQGAEGDFNPDCNFDQDELLSSSFPGCSEYILSIGATMLKADDTKDLGPFSSPYCQNQDCATSNIEIPCSYPDALITTGGGFALWVDQPYYQHDEVKNYLNSGVKLPARGFDTTKRAYPDVSAVGHNFYIQYLGSQVLVDGTSCSAPVWGGIMSRLNAARLSKGKPVLGFVNILFYQMFEQDRTFFNDITEGNNDCTEKCCGVGFESAKGWDPVTGLGTPNYPKILDYVTNTLP